MPKPTVLWICPKCDGENTNLLSCKSCAYMELFSAVIKYAKESKSTQRKDRLIIGVICAGLLGLGAFFGVSAWPDTPDEDSLQVIRATPTPTPRAPVPPSTNEPVWTGRVGAFQEFVANNYPGWTLEGYEDTENYPLIDLHIVKGKQIQIVKVMYRNFAGAKAGRYNLVTKVTETDLLKNSLDHAEYIGKENAGE